VRRSAATGVSWRLRPQAIAGFRWMTSEKFRGRHALFPRGLQLRDFDDTALLTRERFARSYEQGFRKALVRKWSPGGDGRVVAHREGIRLADDQAQRRFWVAMQERVRRRPRLHRPDLVAHLLGGAVPVDEAMLLPQFRRLGRQRLVLLEAADGAGGNL